MKYCTGSNDPNYKGEVNFLQQFYSNTVIQFWDTTHHIGLLSKGKKGSSQVFQWKEEYLNMCEYLRCPSSIVRHQLLFFLLNGAGIVALQNTHTVHNG